MKSFKIYATVANAVQIAITNHNAYSGKPYINITEPDGTVITFYEKVDYDGYIHARRDLRENK
jgi:hypothetical protein